MAQQPGVVSARERSAAPFSLDVTRLEQFLALERDLFALDADSERLAERLAQGVATFLGLAGAAVGLVGEDGRYRLLAAYGLHPAYPARYEGATPRDPVLARALATGQPVVVPEGTGSAEPRTVLLPFRGNEPPGALHLVASEGASLSEHTIEVAQAIAVLAGVALANARHCRRLADVARSKGDALTAMAHDLRAPLNALVGYAALLREGAYGQLTDEQQSVSRTLERQALELVDLMGATLDVARIETGDLPLRVEEFTLADLVAGLTGGTFAAAIHEGALTCRVPADLPRLDTDRVKVKRILQNLVDNALKYGAGTVEIEAAAAPARDTVRLTVRDAGPGIPPELLPQLFEPLRPGAGRGSGFGLYLVRRFAEALGGRVAARSSPGEGTAVTVELPVTAPRR